MPYVAWLNLDLEQARVLRDALADYLRRKDITEEQRDTAIEIQVTLLKQTRKARQP